MTSLPIGLVLFALALAYSLRGEGLGLYLNAHAIVIVVLGTVALFALATPVAVLRTLTGALARLSRPVPSLDRCSEDLAALAASRWSRPEWAHPLLRYAAGLKESGVDPELFIVLLSQHRAALEGEGADAVQALRNLAKYPPALGMMGTVMGLVTTFSKLGSDRAGLGSALALAMTATFFGLTLANGVISPLADRLQIDLMARRRVTTRLYQALLLINRGEEPSLLDSDAPGDDAVAGRHAA